MKKINYLLLAMMAMVCVGFSSCDDDDYTPSNYEKYQRAVDAEVAKTKKHDKALLLAAFGSTWVEAHQTFANVKAQFEENFPDYDVYFAFTSAICINNSAAGEHTEGVPVNFYSPAHYLEAFGRKQYSEILVQSLHIIPGEEYLRLRDTYIKDFKNNTQRDLDEEYLENVKIYIGGPLMAEEEDVRELATVLNGHFSQYVQDGVFALMGHGNPEGYNYGNGNVRYTQLEEALHNINPNYFVGTVDMEDNFVENVLERMQSAGIPENTKVTCHALMSIAGDHAHNDMAGVGYTQAELGDSWRGFFTENHYPCGEDDCILKGLGDYSDVVDIWIEHSKNPVQMFAE